MNPFEFLELLWTDKPENLFVLIWKLDGRESRWFQNLTDAANFVEEARADVYVGVGLSDRDRGVHRRCPSGEVAGLGGFWADFDLLSDAHPAKALPTSIEEALTIIPAEFPPTIIITTGNGVHCWWMFREIWIFEGEEERKNAAALLSRFHTLLRYNANQHGWTYERLSDLARVLRIPGTVNAKDREKPKDVEMYALTGRRYNPSDFAAHLQQLEVPDGEAQERAAKRLEERFRNQPLAINLDARIPQQTIDGWIARDMKFKNTWFRQRHDLKDQSQSGYDMALASFGVRIGLKEQEIVNLIIHHRALHNQKQRTTIDYFQRTIAKVFDCAVGPVVHGTADVTAKVTSHDDEHGGSKEGHKGLTTFDDHGDRNPTTDGLAPESAGVTNPGAPKNSTNTTVARAQAWDYISQVLRIRIYRVVKITGKQPLYRMELEGGKIEFRHVSNLVKQDHLRMAIAGTVNHLFPKIKPKEWEQLAQMMLAALTEQDGGEEVQIEGEARMHVSQYLADVAFINSPVGQSFQDARRPMIHENAVIVCSTDIQRYVNKAHGGNLSVTDVVAMLSALGATNFRLRSKEFSEQSRWSLPFEKFPPADYLKQTEGAVEC